jgi:malate dehydrogenase (oxaloacetate-decarboxylating)(NADP+)
MRPVFERARKVMARVAYAEGEDDRVLRAVQTVVDEGLARPVLIGRRTVIAERVKRLALRLDLDRGVEIVDPSDPETLAPLVETYTKLMGRRGVAPMAAARRVATRPTVTASLLLQAGRVDAALVGGQGDWWRHMTYALPIIPRREGASRVYALSTLILPIGPLFFCDTHVNVDPTAPQIAEMTVLAAEEVRRFGITPKVALLSHSNFGASNSPSARKMREALALIRERAPELEVDGEMHADAALREALRDGLVTDSPLRGSANLLVMPSLDAANIALTLLNAASDALLVGPVLLGLSKPLDVLIPAVTARGIVNLTALAACQVAEG